MAHRIGLIGHCGPDSTYLRIAVSKAERDARVLSLGDERQLQSAIAEGIDLLLVNRLLDGGFVEQQGLDLIRRLRADHPSLKMMLISNYPETQAEAMAAGANEGFGKSQIGTPEVTELLRRALG